MAAVALVESPTVVRRLTATLLAAQSIASLGTTAAITIGAIAATQLTGTEALAGLPSTLFTLGTAFGAYPAGRLMERYGRRFGLILGFVIGIGGSLLSPFALVHFLPLLFFAAYGVLGLARGALDQARFAAADIVLPEHRARSVGWVVLGGTVGGIGGPLVIGPASRLAAQFGLDLLTGPYFASVVLFAVGAFVMFTMLRPDPRDLGLRLAQSVKSLSAANVPPRTFRQVLQSVNVQMALTAMVLGQVVMVAVMVMTPVQMTEHLGHTLDQVSFVIAAHVTGMYATSLVTGRIADRVGHAKTILVGAVVLVVACVLAPFANDPWRLAVALFILGAGWNFCFVAGSTLLTDSLLPHERARIQGTNDLIVGLVAGAGSLGSGLAFEQIGYTGIAAVGILLAVSLFGIALWTMQRRQILRGSV